LRQTLGCLPDDEGENGIGFNIDCGVAFYFSPMGLELFGEQK
jgi:hypothetical protein